ncbi:hypothetical protein [Numidum massiliense]|nr:hypothetical protein [Numidum massiliense]
MIGWGAIGWGDMWCIAPAQALEIMPVEALCQAVSGVIHSC